MRAGMLTVPPAPGMRPIDSSGSRNRARSVAVTVAQNAASSIPAPTHAPSISAVARSAMAASQGAALARLRIRVRSGGV